MTEVTFIGNTPKEVVNKVRDFMFECFSKRGPGVSVSLTGDERHLNFINVYGGNYCYVRTYANSSELSILYNGTGDTASVPCGNKIGTQYGVQLVGAFAPGLFALTGCRTADGQLNLSIRYAVEIIATPSSNYEDTYMSVYVGSKKCAFTHKVVNLNWKEAKTYGLKEMEAVVSNVGCGQWMYDDLYAIAFNGGGTPNVYLDTVINGVGTFVRTKDNFWFKVVEEVVEE